MDKEHIEVFREQVKDALDNAIKTPFPCYEKESVKIVFEEFINNAISEIRIICETFPDDFYVNKNIACDVLQNVLWRLDVFKIVCVKNNLPKGFSSRNKENIIELPNGISIVENNKFNALLVDDNFLVRSSETKNDYIASIDGKKQTIQGIKKLVDSFITNFKKEQN